MTFNPNSDIRGGKTSRRGRTTGLAIGGGGGVVLLLVLASQLFGVDLTGLSGLVGGSGSQGSGAVHELSECKTGADANENVDCRMQGAAASLDAYWSGQFSSGYTQPDTVLFSGSVSTACGGATSAVGPFYCPGDETIYIDTTFFDELRSQFGAQGGPLAEMYVVAHEFGHHIQNLTGTTEKHSSRAEGATSDSVRMELQADCYAGAWTAAASTTQDSGGQAFLQPVTQQQVADALNAASVIGDDRIQKMSGNRVNPETWTHGSSEQRQKWFQTGFDKGPNGCDTFAVRGSQL